MPFKHYGSNSNKYESRHLLPGRAIASGDEEDNRDHQPSSESSFRERLSSASPLRKAFFARVLVLGVFAVSAGTGRYLVTSRNRVHASDSSGIAAREGTLAKQESSMVTSECTPPSLPVLEGADMVSYFSLEEGDGAVFGDEQYESVYNGYRFWFQSEENQALFEEQPTRYIPAWGGFCSWGISEEDWWTAENLGPQADPNMWLITDDGILHFFRSATPKGYFEVDIPRYVVDGDAIWAGWWGEGATAGVGEGHSPLDTNCFCDEVTCIDNA